jgi:hypothetical protein
LRHEHYAIGYLHTHIYTFIYITIRFVLSPLSQHRVPDGSDDLAKLAQKFVAKIIFARVGELAKTSFAMRLAVSLCHRPPIKQ